MDVLKKIAIAFIVVFGVPLVVILVIKATGNDEIWGVARISQYFSIFYYYGICKAEDETRKSIARKQLPLFIKWLLFLWVRNKFTMHTIVYQAIMVIMAMIASLLIFFTKIDSDLVSGAYIIFGYLAVVIASIIWNRSSKR